MSILLSSSQEGHRVRCRRQGWRYSECAWHGFLAVHLEVIELSTVLLLIHMYVLNLFVENGLSSFENVCISSFCHAVTFTFQLNSQRPSGHKPCSQMPLLLPPGACPRLQCAVLANYYSNVDFAEVLRRVRLTKEQGDCCLYSTHDASRDGWYAEFRVRGVCRSGCGGYVDV